MFHSAARSTQGAQITDLKPSDGKVTVVGPVPEGTTRYCFDFMSYLATDNPAG